jgi:hypothetical protein
LPVINPDFPPLKEDGLAFSRNSSGLDQFFFALRDTAGLSILDMSQASQANISFITGLGHRIYAEDVLQMLYAEFAPGDFYGDQADPDRGQSVLDQSLNFEPGHFDGALVWDTLQYISQPLLQTVVDRLYEILRPNAYVLAFFNAEERNSVVQHFSYRIAGSHTLTLTPRGMRKPACYLSSRALERLFQRFQMVKFFLTRDNLREVLIKR